MSALPLVALTALEFEDHEFFAATLRDDFPVHLGSLDERRSEARRLAAEEQYFGESDLIARISVEFFNVNEVALCDAVLFAAGADDCV